MLVTVDGQIYTMSFQHEPDWTPPQKQRRSYPRHVVGRTLCTLSIINRDSFCPRHGKIRMPPTEDNKPEPCICDQHELTTGAAYCSQLDQYNKDKGRRNSLKVALSSAFPDTYTNGYQIRRVFWHTYLNRNPKHPYNTTKKEKRSASISSQTTQS